MICYCDTSFFIRQLLPGRIRSEAIEQGAALQSRLGYVPLTAFTRLEVIQGLRFEAWLNRNDKTKGHPAIQVDTALNLFLAQIGPVSRVIDMDWNAAFSSAEALTRTTPEKGWRTLDVIHVACAMTSGAKTFYSYDQNQNLLASREGLETPLLKSEA